MDLDYLTKRYEDSLRRAINARDSTARISHEGLAHFYAEWINEEKLRRAGEQIVPRSPIA